MAQTLYNDGLRIVKKPYPVDNDLNVFHDYHTLQFQHQRGENPTYQLLGRGASRELTKEQFQDCLFVLFNS